MEDSRQEKPKRKPGGKDLNIDVEFAMECKRKREELGATLESFWGSLGVAKSTGSRYESGERGMGCRSSGCIWPCTVASRSMRWSGTGKTGRNFFRC